METEKLTFEQYCDALDQIENSLNEGILADLRGVPKKLMAFIKPIREYFSDISIKDIIKAFKSSKVFKALKYFGFSLKKMAVAINKGLALLDKGLLKVIAELHKTNIFQQIRSGVVKLDAIIDQYPILNHITGVAVAGILLIIWLNMSFSGHFDHDMDLSTAFKALVGKFSLDELFASEIGNKMLILLATGIVTGGGLSFPWLLKSSVNLAVAMVYSVFKLYKQGDISMDIIKQRVLRKRLQEGMKTSFKEFLKEGYKPSYNSSEKEREKYAKKWKVDVSEISDDTIDIWDMLSMISQEEGEAVGVHYVTPKTYKKWVKEYEKYRKTKSSDVYGAEYDHEYDPSDGDVRVEIVEPAEEYR